MKRNYDLIREILLAVEQQPCGNRAITLKTVQFAEKFPKITPDELNDHIEMLVEQKFLEGEGHQFGWFIIKLTWAGHDFIEQSRENTVWKKAKHYAGHLTLDVFASTLKECAVSFAKSFAVADGS